MLELKVNYALSLPSIALAMMVTSSLSQLIWNREFTSRGHLCRTTISQNTLSSLLALIVCTPLVCVKLLATILLDRGGKFPGRLLPEFSKELSSHALAGLSYVIYKVADSIYYLKLSSDPVYSRDHTAGEIDRSVSGMGMNDQKGPPYGKFVFLFLINAILQGDAFWWNPRTWIILSCPLCVFLPTVPNLFRAHLPFETSNPSD